METRLRTSSNESIQKLNAFNEQIEDNKKNALLSYVNNLGILIKNYHDINSEKILKSDFDTIIAHSLLLKEQSIKILEIFEKDKIIDLSNFIEFHYNNIKEYIEIKSLN